MRRRLIVVALAATALVLVTGSAFAAASQSAVIFDSTVKTGPKSNVPSYGPEAYSTAQVGGKATFAGSKRKLSNVVVTLSSWACAGGTWNNGCVTPTGAKYSLPITLNIYNENDNTLVASKTQNFDVSYRPSANPAKCEVPTKWYSTTDKTCFNGLAQDVTFTFDGTKTLPNTVRYAITYGTSHYGSNPQGDQACTSTTAGCFYDSLNVALTDANVGTSTGTLFFDAAGSSSVADAAYTPAVQFKAA